MIECLKLQVEFRKGEEIHRCLNPKAEHYKLCVNDDICLACPVRMLRMRPVYSGPDLATMVPQHGGQLWLEGGEILEKLPDGSSFLIGDWVEAHLSMIGMTKEKWIEIKTAVGAAPTCDCDERKEWLNRVGTKFGNAVKNSFTKIWS